MRLRPNRGFPRRPALRRHPPEIGSGRVRLARTGASCSTAAEEPFGIVAQYRVIAELEPRITEFAGGYVIGQGSPGSPGSGGASALPEPALTAPPFLTC